MKRAFFVRFIICWCFISLATTAHAVLFYQHDFQWDIGAQVPGWSAGTIQSAPNPDYGGWRRFLGEFGDEEVNLSLNNLPTHASVTLSFELYLLRSWDGEATDYGKDIFGLKLGQQTLFSASFSNGHPAGQSYCPGSPSLSCSPMTGASERYSLGYVFDTWDVDANKTEGEVMDAVYRFSFTFAHTSQDLVLTFFGQGLQGWIDAKGYRDESWGLDNVTIELHQLPEPVTAALVILALMVFFLGQSHRVRRYLSSCHSIR